MGTFLLRGVSRCKGFKGFGAGQGKRLLTMWHLYRVAWGDCIPHKQGAHHPDGEEGQGTLGERGSEWGLKV